MAQTEYDSCLCGEAAIAGMADVFPGMANAFPAMADAIPGEPSLLDGLCPDDHSRILAILACRLGQGDLVIPCSH